MTTDVRSELFVGRDGRDGTGVHELRQCLTRQAERKQVGVVAYSAPQEDANFAEILVNMTPREKALALCFCVGAVWAGAFGLFVAGLGLKAVVSWLL